MSTLHSASQLEELINHQGDQSISILMHTHESGSQVQQNAIRFKNLLSEVTEQLTTAGEAGGDLKKRLEPLHALQRDDNFWQHQSAGLGVYFSEGRTITIKLHDPTRDMAIVSDRFYVTPAAIDAAGARRYLVLTLSWDEARLYSANRVTIEAMEESGFPVSFSDVVLPADAEEQLQFRTHGQRPGETMYHGQGGGEGSIEADRLRFLSEVGKRLSAALDSRRSALIVVGAEELQGEFATVNKVRPSHTIAGSPAGLSSHELRERVLSVMNAGDDNESRVGERLGTALAGNRASREIDEILQAAAAGRVQELLVNSGIVHEEQLFALDVLERVNLAVISTLQAGGELTQCSDAVLNSSPIAAIFRY